MSKLKIIAEKYEDVRKEYVHAVTATASVVAKLMVEQKIETLTSRDQTTTLLLLYDDTGKNVHLLLSDKTVDIKRRLITSEEPVVINELKFIPSLDACKVFADTWINFVEQLSRSAKGKEQFYKRVYNGIENLKKIL